MIDYTEKEATDSEILREVAQWIFHNVSPAMGLDQYHCDRLTHIARRIEQDG